MCERLGRGKITGRSRSYENVQKRRRNWQTRLNEVLLLGIYTFKILRHSCPECCNKTMCWCVLILSLVFISGDVIVREPQKWCMWQKRRRCWESIFIEHDLFISSLFNDALNSLGSLASNKTRFVNKDLKRKWTKAVVAYFKKIFRCLPEGLIKNTKQVRLVNHTSIRDFNPWFFEYVSEGRRSIQKL